MQNAAEEYGPILVRVVVVVFGGGGRVSRSYFHENSFGRNLYEGKRKVYRKFGICTV